MASKVNNFIKICGLTNEIPTNPKIFKQFSLDEIVEIPLNKPDIEQIVKVVAEIKIICTKIIKTPKCTSLEGQILTGLKLIIEGEINQKIEYVADLPTQPVHSAHFIIPFNTFIVLPEDFIIGNPLLVKSYIEEIFIEKLSKRKVFMSFSIFIDTRCK